MSAMNRKILAVDDDQEVRDSYSSIFSIRPSSTRIAEATNIAHLFDAVTDEGDVSVDLHLAEQGEEALELVQQAIAAGEPFSVVMLDINMPPGWDGIRTAREIRQVDPDIMIVMVTAMPHFDLRELRNELGEGVLFLSKPFEADEVYLLVLALCESWSKLQDNMVLADRIEQILQQQPAEQRQVDELLGQLEQSHLQLEEASKLQERLKEQIRQKAHDLKRLAILDELTGVYNQRAFDDRIKEKLERARRLQNIIALFYLQLDDLQQVCAGMGEEAKTEVLQHIALLLKKLVRQYDIVFRLDECRFAVILDHPASRREVEKVADRILGKLVEPISLAAGEVRIQVAIGIGLYPEQARSTEQLIQMSNDAVKSAADAGKQCWRIYEPERVQQSDINLENPGNLFKL